MKIGDKVDVFDDGAEFEAEIVGINDENGTVAVRDARGVLYNYLPKAGVEGSIRHYSVKKTERAPAAKASAD